MKKALRVTYYTGIIVLFLLIAVAGLTQTKLFRSYLHTAIVEGVADATRGELILGEIQGNLITGFRVMNMEVRESGRPILAADRIEFRYDPLGFFLRRITLARISIENPRIQVIRSTDGSWNIDRFLRPTPPDSVASSWVIDLKQLDLVQGTFLLVDSLQLKSKVSNGATSNQSMVNYAELTLTSLKLQASARLGARQMSVGIRHLSFESHQPEFELKNLSGQVAFTPTKTKLSMLDISTQHSHLVVDGEMEKSDGSESFEIKNVKDNSIKIHLRADPVDLAEVRMFVGHSIDFLEGRLNGELRVNGTLASLKVETLSLQTPRSSIRLQGTVSNLHHPDELELDVTALNATIDPDDAMQYVPGPNLPDLRRLGMMKYNIHFKGKPLAFFAQVQASSRAGNINFKGEFKLRDKPQSYDVALTTQNLDPGVIFADENLTSRINAELSLKGSGTSLSAMRGVLRVDIDSSEFFHQPVRQSVIVANVNDGVLRPRVLVNWGLTRLDISGQLAGKKNEPVLYRMDGKVNSLNLAHIFKNKGYESDLSFDIESHGSASSWNDMDASLAISFLRSMYGRHQFQQGELRAELRPVEGQRQRFRLTSDVADVDISGQFSLPSFVSLAEEGVQLLYQAMEHRIATLDSLRGFSPQPARPSAYHTTLTTQIVPLDATYALQIKNLSPLGVFFGQQLKGSATLSGSLRNRGGATDWRGKISIPSLQYDDQTHAIYVLNTHLEHRIEKLRATNTLSGLDVAIKATSSLLILDSLSFGAVRLAVTHRGDTSDYFLATVIDSTVHLETNGTAIYRNGLVSLEHPSCRVAINNYWLDAIEPLKVMVGRDGFHIQDLAMRHEAEELRASGYFNPWGVSDLRLTLRNFVLNNIRNFAREAPASGTALDFGGLVDAEGLFRGSLDHPNLSLSLNAVGARYRETVFGQLVVRLSYFERLLNVFSEFRSKPEQVGVPPDLLVSGSVPYDFSLSGARAQNLEGQMDLEVRTKGFRLEFLDPFLPVLRNLSGTMVCDMKMKGTIQAPSYEGSMSLSGARFLFEPMNMQFIVDGQFIPSEKKIALQNVTVTNVPQDRGDGLVHLSGTFTLEGIKIRDFDLQADGQLLIMKESTRRPGQTIFGDLFTATGPSGLRWNGTPSRSLLNGRVLVKAANLTFPPTREAEDLPTRRIPVILVLDTLRDQPPRMSSAQASTGAIVFDRVPPLAEESRSDSADPLLQRLVERSPFVEHPTTSASREEKSFLDHIVYDLSIETQGVTQVRFIFNNLTNEELFADLKGTASFTKEGSVTRLTGEVEVGNRSYYNFLKKLEASGKLIFTGEAMNPELNVVAKYEGIYQGKDTTGTSAASNRSSGISGSLGNEQKVVVTLTITGTRNKPEVKTELTRYAANGTELPTPADAEADAIAFLLTGQFRDDLTQQERRSLIGGNMLYGFTSSVLSGPLSDLLRKEFGVIRSVDVLYYGGSFQEAADVRLTGEVGDAVIRLGGRVFNDINNTNVSIQLPMSGLLGSERWRNLVLELERRVEGVESLEQRRESKAVKILYRIVF